MYLFIFKRPDIEAPNSFLPDEYVTPKQKTDESSLYDTPIYFKDKDKLPEIIDHCFCNYQDNLFSDFSNSSLADFAYAQGIYMEAWNSKKQNSEQTIDLEDYEGQGEGSLNFGRIDFSDIDRIYISTEETFCYYTNSETFEDTIEAEFYGQIFTLA